MRPNYSNIKYQEFSQEFSHSSAKMHLSVWTPSQRIVDESPITFERKNQQRNAPVVTRIRVDSVPTVCGPDEVTATLPARRRLPSLSPVSPAASTYRMKRRK